MQSPFSQAKGQMLVLPPESARQLPRNTVYGLRTEHEVLGACFMPVRPNAAHTAILSFKGLQFRSTAGAPHSVLEENVMVPIFNASLVCCSPLNSPLPLAKRRKERGSSESGKIALLRLGSPVLVTASLRSRRGRAFARPVHDSEAEILADELLQPSALFFRVFTPRLILDLAQHVQIPGVSKCGDRTPTRSLGRHPASQTAGVSARVT